MNILIAEDHPLYMIGIEHMLKQFISKATIFKAPDFKKALRLLDLHKFELMVLDIVIPYGDKIGMVESVRLKQPNLPVLICSAYEESLYALPYLKSGANGYISKSAPPGDFKKAVDLIMQGKTYASQEVMSNMFDMILAGKSDHSLLIDSLSVREAEIARLLVKGLSTKQIGESINLSSSAVSNYKTKIFKKLEVDNVIELSQKLEARK